MTGGPVDMLPAQRVGSDMHRAAARVPFPDPLGFEAEGDRAVLQRAPEGLELLEIHTVDHGSCLRHRAKSPGIYSAVVVVVPPAMAAVA